MVKGTVKQFNGRKGFAFITNEGDSFRNDILAHYTGIHGNDNKYMMIFKGDIVEFDIIEGRIELQVTNLISIKSIITNLLWVRGFIEQSVNDSIHIVFYMKNKTQDSSR